MRKTFGIKRGSFLHHFDSGGARHVRRAFRSKSTTFLPCSNPARISKQFFTSTGLEVRPGNRLAVLRFFAAPVVLLFGGAIA
jgi:hypothetical protein